MIQGSILAALLQALLNVKKTLFLERSPRGLCYTAVQSVKLLNTNKMRAALVVLKSHLMTQQLSGNLLSTCYISPG